MTLRFYGYLSGAWDGSLRLVTPPDREDSCRSSV